MGLKNPPWAVYFERHHYSHCKQWQSCALSRRHEGHTKLSFISRWISAYSGPAVLCLARAGLTPAHVTAQPGMNESAAGGPDGTAR